jgi:nicotinamide-nucleotide amidase
VIDRPLEEDGGVVESIRLRFAARGARMPEINRRQAMVPRGAVLLPNAMGTAPGLWIEHAGCVIILLPGPPGELKPMFDRVVADRLAPLAGDSRVYRRVLRICGRTESEVDEATSPVYSRWLHQEPAVFTTVLTSPAQIELHLSTRAASAPAAEARLDAATADLAAVLGPDLYSSDGRALEEIVGALLRERGWRIAVAESCTGGLVSSRLTDVPGSSDYVTLNVVCYSNESKVSWLGVPQSTIDSCGAVSEPVAEAMADGVRERAGASLGIGVTGIAGPGGGTEAKPVGTVAIAVTTAERRVVRTFRFPVGRARVRQFAAQMALDLARRLLAGVEGGGAFVLAAGAGDRA